MKWINTSAGLINLESLFSITKYDENVRGDLVYQIMYTDGSSWESERFDNKENRDKHFDKLAKLLLKSPASSTMSTAHWQTLQGQYDEIFYKCSNCESPSGYIYKHCPECGAKMEW